MSLSEICSGGQTSILKISTGGQTSAPKISSGGQISVAFSTGGQMSINRFSKWGQMSLGAYVLESFDIDERLKTIAHPILQLTGELKIWHKWLPKRLIYLIHYCVYIKQVQR